LRELVVDLGDDLVVVLADAPRHLDVRPAAARDASASTL
jgi:hypothetical protein